MCQVYWRYIFTMPEKHSSTNTKVSATNKCSCCPYGFHIDRDFVRFCDSLYNSAQLDKLRQHRRERKKEKKSIESYLGLGNLPAIESSDKEISPVNLKTQIRTLPKDFYLQNDDLNNAVTDFEDVWRNSLKKSNGHNVISTKNGLKHSNTIHDISTHIYNSNKNDSVHDMASRSNSLSSVSSQSTTISNSEPSYKSKDSNFNSFTFLSSSNKYSNNPNQLAVGINKTVLTNIREQMASSLQRMKELEDQVKCIPLLKVKISVLDKEKKSLLNEIKMKDNILTKKELKGKTNLEHQLRKLENEGIMSPTLSRKCLLSRRTSDDLFSPSIASSLDDTINKKCFIEKQIISEMKMNDLHISENLDKMKNTKNVGTSCTVLTRDIGVGCVSNKYKSVAVGEDLSISIIKGPLDTPASISSESLESDIDSMSESYSRYSKKIHSSPIFSPVMKKYVESSTSTEYNLRDKCTNTEKLIDVNSNQTKLLRHKAVQVVPSVSGKFIQTTEKQLNKNVSVQTKFDVSDTANSLNRTRKSVGIGDFSVTAETCDRCTEKYVTPREHKDASVGDIDINAAFCENCEREKNRTISVRSVQVNTIVESALDTNIHICDKCSETIHSVANDLAADTKIKAIPKLHTNISKISISKTKSTKEKSALKPLKISQLSSTKETFIPVKERKSTIETAEKYVSEITAAKEVLKIEDESPSADLLPNFTDLPVLPRKKVHPSKEMKAACKVLNDYLSKSAQNRGSEKKIQSSLDIVKNEWFRIANQKNADPHLMEDYLDAFEEFSKLLLHHVVNLSDNNLNTALHYAVSYGNFDAVSVLIDSKVCDVNKKNKAGYTSIMLVALAEIQNDAHKYVIQRLFSIGDINMKATENGQTALMLAVSHGKRDIVNILLEVGAEVNLQDKDGSTALMCAAEHGHLEIAKILLAHSECDPTIVDNDGCNALTIAMDAGHKDIGLLIYTNMNFSRGSSPYSSLKTRKRSSSRSTPPPRTPTLRTPPIPSPATRSLNSLPLFQFPN